MSLCLPETLEELNYIIPTCEETLDPRKTAKYCQRLDWDNVVCYTCELDLASSISKNASHSMEALSLYR